MTNEIAPLRTLALAIAAFVSLCAVAASRGQDAPFGSGAPGDAVGQTTNPTPQGNQSQVGAANPSGTRSAPSSATASTNVAEAQLAPFYRLPSGRSDIVGETLTVDRALLGANAPFDRRRRLVAYWDLSYKFAYCNLCAQHRSYVSECATKLAQKYGTSATAEVKELATAAQNIAEERYQAARLTFVQAQYDFDAAFVTPAGRRAALARAEAAQRARGTTAPLASYAALYVPATPPSTAAFELRASQRRLSGEAARLSALTPLLYETLQARANAAKRSMALLVSAFKSSTVGDAALFDAVDSYRDEQDEALKAAMRYNQAIAAFVAETAPANATIDALLEALNLRSSNAANNPRTNPSQDSAAPQQNQRPQQAAPANPTQASNDLQPVATLASLGAESNSNDAAALFFIQPNDATLQTSSSAPMLMNVGYVVPVEPAPAPTQPPQPAAQPTQPAAQPTQPAAQPPQPAAQPTQPAAQPTQPAAQPTQPAAQPSNSPEETNATDKQETSTPESATNTPEKQEEKKEPEPAPQTTDPKKEEKKEPTVAQRQDVEKFFPIVVLVTGYEQAPDDARDNANDQRADRANENPETAPNGAQTRRPRAFEIASFFEEMIREVKTNRVARETTSRDETRVARGQAPSGDAEPSARSNATDATDALERDRQATQRANAIARELFAVASPNPASVKVGEEERLFSLQEAELRGGRFAESRREIAVAYWRLHAAVARLRVEETLYQTELKLLNSLGEGASAQRDACVASALKEQALVAEARALKRASQLRLMQLIGLTPDDAGYPLPSTPPFCGLKCDLGTPPYADPGLMRRGAVALERLKTLKQLSLAMGAPSAMLSVDPSTVSEQNIETTVASLEKKREQILLFIDQIAAFNCALADYVASFPANVSADRFVEALVGKGF